MLDSANSGPEPTVEILRAIRHGVAAGAFRAAGRATGDAAWIRKADDQRENVRRALHQATSRPVPLGASSFDAE